MFLNATMRHMPVILACLLVLVAGCSKPTKGECDPACGPDEYCEDGACIPYCDPPCPPGWYCYHPTGACFFGSLPDALTDSDWEPESPCSAPDTDGDWIPDDVEGEGDVDGDTIPNMEDDDSDGDTILDEHEAGDIDCDTEPWDDDGDGAPDYLDLDSDDDGIPDEVEAGDSDPDTRPRDTDGWGHADFRDTDSDNDGMGDAREEAAGTQRLVADSDGDGVDDMTEMASLVGDPLDPDSVPEPDERIYTLFYRGRSATETFLFTLRYERTDVFYLVDATYGASPAVEAGKAVLGPAVIPEMDILFDGLRTGVAHFTGWRMPDVFMEASCRRPFVGLARLAGPAAGMVEPFGTIPRCPEPTLGSSLVEGLFQAVGEGSDTLWPAGDACTEGVGGACFDPAARRVLVILMQGGFPDSTPPGYGPYHSMEQVSALAVDRGIHVVGLVAADAESDPAFGPLASLATQTAARDLHERPLVYLMGSGGEDAETMLVAAAQDVATRMPQDVTFDAVDADDWPPGLADFDATPLVMSVYPEDWSPPPGISPLEACDGMEMRKFLDCVPGTEIAYQVYYRNYAQEQTTGGAIYGVTLELTGADGYLFESFPVRFIVPALNGDSTEE